MDRPTAPTMIPTNEIDASPATVRVTEEHKQTASPVEEENQKASLQLEATSRWKTLLTFVLGDLVMSLLLSWGIHIALLEAFPERIGAAFPAFSFLLPVLLLLLFAFSGLYRQKFCHPALEMPRVATVTGVMGGTAALTVIFVTGDPLLALPVALWGLLGMVLVPLGRSVTRVLWSRASWWGVSAVLLTSGQRGDGILQTLRQWPEIGLRPIAVLNDAETDGGETSSFKRGSYEQAPQLARKYGVPYAIVSGPSLSDDERASLLLRHAKFFDHVLVLPDEPSPASLWSIQQSGDGLIGYSMRHASLRTWARFLRRALDFIGALVIALLLIPVLAAIAIAVARDSAGGVLYRQQRLGREGRIFTVLKFRTMYQDAEDRLESLLEDDPALREEYEQYHKLEDDPRVTSVGRFLRRYSLDELPQIFNVLRGEMSLVGPRAYMPSELPKMDRIGRAVLQVPPGVTGLWQVSGRNRLSFRKRLELDLHYVQNWSVWLDLYLLVRTIPTVLSGHGAS